MSLRTTSLSRPRYEKNPQRVTLATAWQRFWSRHLDMTFCSLILVFLLGVVSYYLPGFVAKPANLTEMFTYAVILITILMAMDAFCLAFLGQTFGRALAGIKVIKKSGDRLTFFEALYRNLQVLFFGMGFGLPILHLIVMWFAYFGVRDGIETSWDRSRYTYVISESSSLGSTILTAALNIILMFTINLVHEGFNQSRDEAAVTTSDVSRSGA